MKHLLILLLLCASLVASAQRKKADTVILTLSDELIVTRPEFAQFTGYAIPAAFGWTAVIYNSDGDIMARGNYSNRKCNEKQGWFTFYYPDGQRASSGEYRKDRKQGLWRFWYPDGKLSDSLWYDKGVPDGQYFTFFESGVLAGKGIFKAGLEDSTWTWYHGNGMISSVEEYRWGLLKGQRCMDSMGKIQLDLCRLFSEPRNKDNKTMSDLLQEEARKLRDAGGKPIEGTVLISIHMTNRGELKDLRVLRADRPELSSVVQQTMRSNQWTPAYTHNRPVTFKRTLELPFAGPRGIEIRVGNDPLHFPTGLIPAHF